MVNKIWASFIIIGILLYIVQGRIDDLNIQLLSSAEGAFQMILRIFPVMALWLGIMNIAQVSGLLNKLAIRISPILCKLFPEIPKNHESLGYIASNVAVNMFGLGSVATPFGLKAMRSMQTLNPDKKTATRSMITFLVLNTSGLTIIPTTVISLRVMHNSNAPNEIVLACIISTIISTAISLIIDAVIRYRGKK
jgi:spore maturation protein A